MENRVGQKIPSEKQIEKLRAEVAHVAKQSEGFTIGLSSTERQSVLKFRPGGRDIVMLVAKLAKQCGLALPTLPIDDMLADLELATVITPVRDEAAALAQRYDDTKLEAEAECWSTMTAYYNSLARLAETDHRLAQELKPVIEFFALGRRRAKAPAPQDPPAPAK